MSKKILFVGPHEVGKSTLRKWIFEGESIFNLLQNPLEPTYGFENHPYHILEHLGVFDLAGQETDRWFTSDKEVFTESDIIINVLDARDSFEDIKHYIKDVLFIERVQAPKGIIFFLIHKIDLLEDAEFNKLQKALQAFSLDNPDNENEDLNIFYTSIKPEYIDVTINAFINVFQEAKLDEVSEIDTHLQQLNFNLFHNLIQKKVISFSRLQDLLNVSNERLQNLISSYVKSDLIFTKQMEGKILVYINEKGKEYYEKILKSFTEISSEGTIDVNLDNATKDGESVELIYGFLISDDIGKTLLSVETKNKSLISALNRTNNSQFDLELIPMFLNAMSKFAEEINVKDLSSFRVQGANLKMSSLSKQKFTLTIFSDPSIKIDYIKEDFSTMFDYFVDDYQDIFKDFEKTGNSSLFKDFIPKAERELQRISGKYQKLADDYNDFNIEDAKEVYTNLNKIQEDKFPIEKQLRLKTLKIQLLEAIIAENIQTCRNIEIEIKKDY